MSNDPTYNVGLSGAQIKDLLTSINFPSLAEKLTRHDDDNLLVWDSEDANKAKKTKVSNLIPRVSNKNLLHNWDFRNPVNQRGQSSYTLAYEYTIDRWISNACVMTLGNGYIDITGTDSDAKMFQWIEDPLLRIANAIKTLSVEIGGLIYTITGSGTFTYNFGDFALTTGSDGASRSFFQIDSFNGKTLRVTKVKMELGSVSTLANDPPADYVEELRKCQWYFRLWTTEAARTEALKEVGLMRLASPTLGTISISGTTYYYASAEL